MGEFKNYSEQYLDPRWQKKRLEIMQRDGFACQFCGSEKTTLNVHHRYYKGGKDVWDYPNESLVTLCKKCHQEEEDALKNISTVFIQTLKEAGCESLELGMILRTFENIKNDKEKCFEIAESIHIMPFINNKGSNSLSLLMDEFHKVMETK